MKKFIENALLRKYEYLIISSIYGWGKIIEINLINILVKKTQNLFQNIQMQFFFSITYMMIDQCKVKLSQNKQLLSA